MERKELLSNLQQIIRNTFNNESICVVEETNADDIEEWTSLTHVALITEIENHFDVHFKMREMVSWHCIGDILNSIEQKNKK